MISNPLSNYPKHECTFGEEIAFAHFKEGNGTQINHLGASFIYNS
jgi:hypothetical protein